MKSNTEQGPVRYVIDERLDLNHFGPLRKSYIVASSYRSGSQYLCWRLWQTGLLGAPSEVLNPTSELRVLMSRFNASSPADYIAKLLARRTSRNGVFGMKAHFHHFEAFQKEYPPLLEVLAPTTYIYISRQDRIAQAVSMAKALQTDAWTSRMEEGPKPVLFYDREMIAHCLVDIEQQDATWRRWFETYKITPFQVTYDELTADAARVVRNFVEFLGVQNDERDEVDIPPAKKQADETNQEWIERFEREAKAEGQRQRVGADVGEGSARASGPEPEVSADAHFFDRFNRVVKSIPTGAASATGFLDLIRSRRRYDAIVARNRKLYQNARVLDVMSAYGLWSLAALDAGAVHVVGVEASPPMVEAAANTFRECGVAPHSYRFINSDVLEAIQAFEPEIIRPDPVSGVFRTVQYPSILPSTASPAAEAGHSGHRDRHWRGSDRPLPTRNRRHIGGAQPCAGHVPLRHVRFSMAADRLARGGHRGLDRHPRLRARPAANLYPGSDFIGRRDFGSPPPLLVWPSARPCGIRKLAPNRSPSDPAPDVGLDDIGRIVAGGAETFLRLHAGARSLASSTTKIRYNQMAPIYDDEEFEDEDDDGDGKSPASRRMIAAKQAANQALEDAMQATLNASRYLPWLVIAAAAAAVIAAAAVTYGGLSSLAHPPQSVP